MTEPPRDDSSPTGSAPWERPRRWNQQRLDATRVDDLLARLGNEDDPRGRRGRRRGAERAARGAAAASFPTPTDATAPAEDGDSPAPIPAGDLIAALGGRAADRDADTTDTASDTTDTASDENNVADQDSTATDRPPDASASAPSTSSATPASSATDDPAEAALDAHGGPGRVTAPGMDDHVTDQLPKIVEEDIASIRASLRLQAGGAAEDDEAAAPPGSSAETLGRATGAAADGTSAAADPAGPGGPTDPPAGSGSPGGHGPDEPDDGDRRRIGFLAAGRVAIAAVAVVLLLLTGFEWNTLQSTETGLQEKSGSYLATADPAISTAPAPTPQASTGSATAATTEALPLYPAENILLLGSDSRADGNGNGGNSDSSTGGSANSDTMMLAHISADRQHIAILSFPRFLQIKAPSCQSWDYTNRKQSGVLVPVSGTSRWRISNAYAVGGPACSVLAVQGLTGLRIDRVIDIDFNGFKSMVDALQGVEVNVCKPIVDKKLQTVVAQGGIQRVSGDQALSLVRAREVVGDSTGTDGRMRRQQVVLAAMLRQVSSAGTLLNPARLNSFLKAFVGSTHNDNVTVESLIQLAKQLGNLDPSRVTFYSVPHTQSTTAVDTELLAPSAKTLFAALRGDSLLPGETVAPATPASSAAASSAAGASSATRTPRSPKAPRSSSASSSSSAGPSPAPVPAPQTLTVDPAAVDLQVVNLTGRGGVATLTMNSLNHLGFNITGNDLLLPTGRSADGVSVEYSAENRAAAVTVASAVPGAALVQVPDLGMRVRLMLGTSYDGTVTGVSVGADVPSRYRTTPSTTAANSSAESVTSGGPAGTPDASTPNTSAQSTSMQGPSTRSTSTLSTKELGAINAEDATCA